MNDMDAVVDMPGEQSGPTLVLLHEGLGCVAMWKDFPDRLNQRTGLPVFAYSRFGYVVIQRTERR